MDKKPIQLRKVLLLGTVVSAYVFPSAALAQEAGNELSENAENSENQIIVTALKQGNQDLVTTPAAIAVISGEAIEDLGADQIEDFLQFAPGVSIDEGVSFAGGTTTIQIRGVSATFGSASVGFYLDDLPFSFINLNFLPDPSPYDLKSVEVLKGPQGTLYGAGSAAGVVVVSTNDPNLDEFSGKVDLLGSSTSKGGENYSASAALNVPIVEDKIALRATVSYQDYSGFIDDFSVADASNLNDQQRLNARLKLLMRPTEELEVKLIGAISRIDNGISNDFGDDSFNLDIVSYPTPGFSQGSQSDYDQLGAVVTYEAPSFTIRNAFSYLNFDNETTEPLPLATFGQAFNIETYTNELRINSNQDGPLSWVAGFFYRSSDQRLVQDFDALGPIIGFPDGFDVLEEPSSEQYSVFGEATYSLLDGFVDLTAGLAYVDDKTDNVSSLTGFAAEPARLEVTTSEFLPQASLAIHPNADSTLYFRYAEGVRVGIPNFGISTFFTQTVLPDFTGNIPAEKTTSFEVGAKGEFLDGDLYMELALYTIDIDNLQQSAGVFPPGSDVAFNTVLSVPNARSRGIEWLVRARPMVGLNLQFSGSINDAEIKDDFLAPQAPGDTSEPNVLFADGTPLNLSPDFILSGMASYNWDLGIGDLEATLSGNFQYSDKRPLTNFSQPVIYGGKILKSDVRLEVGTSTKALFVFVENLTNEADVITPSDDQGLFAAFGAQFDGLLGTRLRPRTIGAGLRFKF